MISATARTTTRTTTTTRWWMLVLLGLSSISSHCRANHASFNYVATNLTAHSYGPADWGKVTCLHKDNCTGWPTDWDSISSGVPWYHNYTSNQCQDCSVSTTGACEKHSQSPIRLFRTMTQTRQCIDIHLMRYWAGQCAYSDFRFQVLPHALRMYRPKANCSGAEQPQHDFSRGYPVPFRYAFTDIVVPSQHMMDGKRYAAEVVLSGVFNAFKEDKLIGNIAIMLEEGTEADRYDFLDLHLEGWQKAANATQAACPTTLKRQLRAEEEDGDEIHVAASSTTSRRRRLPEVELHDPSFSKDPSQPVFIPNGTTRTNYTRAWHPYDWYIKANTEYYFRYEGTMTEPPCLVGTHWRVLKNAVRVAPSQLRELERLLRTRIDPVTCQRNSTAGALVTARSANGVQPPSIAVNRPLQTTSQDHKAVYCECIDWESKSEDDLAYCRLTAKQRGVLKYSD